MIRYYSIKLPQISAGVSIMLKGCRDFSVASVDMKINDERFSFLTTSLGQNLSCQVKVSRKRNFDHAKQDLYSRVEPLQVVLLYISGS